jgi:hypothetical protein
MGVLRGSVVEDTPEAIGDDRGSLLSEDRRSSAGS